MQAHVDTAIQWLHDTIRYHLRARKEGKPPPTPGDWVGLCWEIGHSLSMMLAHGIPINPVIAAVSEKLRKEFPGSKGLQEKDLHLMRLFYLNYFERADILPKLRRIPWDRHAFILERCKDPLQQEFYIELCLREGLNREGLSAAFKSQRYELSAAPEEERQEIPGRA